jgi:hypothetical protein
MNGLATLLLVFLLCVPAWTEPPSTKPTSPKAPSPEAAYKQPFPHSSGAELLPFCELTGEPVSQIRCDYYVQAIADMVTIKLKGKRLACIPQGQSRTQLMEIAAHALKKTHLNALERQSAASLIMQAFVKTFPCTNALNPNMVAALKKRLGTGKKKTAPVSAGQRTADALEKRLAAPDMSGWSPEQAAFMRKKLAAYKQKKAAAAAKASADCQCPDASKAIEATATTASSDALKATATPTAVTSPEASQTTAVPQILEAPQ